MKPRTKALVWSLLVAAAAAAPLAAQAPLPKVLVIGTGGTGIMTVGGFTADHTRFSGEIDLNNVATRFTARTGGRVEFSGVVSDAGGGKLKSVSAITMSGFAVNGEVTFAVDGQDYVPTSTPPAPAGMAITQSSERVSDNAYKTSVKVNGEVMTTMLNELSADGQTLTVSSTGAGPAAGMNSVYVLERQ